MPAVSPSHSQLRSLTLAELEQFVAQQNWPAYRAQQIFAWIHARGATDVDAMTNLSKEMRQQLSTEATLAALAIDTVQTSTDGTKKLRLQCSDGSLIESVLIPAADKLTQCLSTQVGCALGCRFCATATMGMKRNLSPGEIVDQVYRAQSLLEPGQRITNLVYMGMGEPMANLANVLKSVDILCNEHGANLSPRRITISTAGVVSGIIEMGKQARHVGLAISLHATTDEVRNSLMPINKRWPLAALMQALRDYPLPRRRRITFEYLLLAGVNDTPADAKRLPKLLNGIPAKVNLLAYNPSRTAQPDLFRPNDDAVDDFAERLWAAGLNTTVRRSRGLDIDAACGQLALGPLAPTNT